jgi:hypothetical protein
MFEQYSFSFFSRVDKEQATKSMRHMAFLRSEFFQLDTSGGISEASNIDKANYH